MNDVFRFSGTFPSADKRNDAVGAVLRAPLHDRHEGRGALGARRGKRVELLDLREADVDLRAPRLAARGEHLRKPVHRLGAEDRVHPGGAVKNPRALLARDAAAHGDHHAGMELLGLADAAEVGEDLLLGLLADRAGVEHHDVGVLKRVRALEPHALMKEVGDAAGVVVIHLAAEAAQVEFFHGHGLDPLRERGRSAGRDCLRFLRRRYEKSPARWQGSLRMSGGASRIRTADTRIMIPLL